MKSSFVRPARALPLPSTTTASTVTNSTFAGNAGPSCEAAGGFGASWDNVAEATRDNPATTRLKRVIADRVVFFLGRKEPSAEHPI